MRRFYPEIVLQLLLFSPLMAQGRTDYFNVESPPVHPIEVFRVGDHDYVAVCNTRDNSLEIWDTSEQLTQRRRARVRTGLEPVSVRFNRSLGLLYTTNFLGDSISVIRVSATSSGGLLATLERTVWIGDEPMDVAFYPLTRSDGEVQPTLLVTHMALDGFGWRDAVTLAPLAGLDLVAAEVPFPVGNDTVQLALKEPRTVLVTRDRLLILATKGGNGAFDYDIYCDDLSQPFAKPLRIPGLGSTGMNMTLDAAGTLYVVGAMARNLELADEPNVRAAESGFVKSMFYAVSNPCRPDQAVRARDVNLRPGLVQPVNGLVGEAQPLPAPVSKAEALSMLTDVAVLETGVVPKVFFTAYGNDRVGVIEPDPAADPSQWPIRRINLDAVNGNVLAGPRGVAIKVPNPESSEDSGARLYVLNHLDSSVTVIDPISESVLPEASFSLAHDPRPPHLTVGQRFLYDASLSGNGMVSCASCHIDGRTDGLAWDLGTPDQEPAEIPAILKDAVGDTHFPSDKGNMVTQSLQGLLNFEVVPSNLFWVTNGPYHWRGDRFDFTQFNGAFESLLGGEILSDQEIRQFEEFVNTIHYPPNPKQMKSRLPSGSAVPASGEANRTSALRGMQIFHESPTVGVRSCVPCHALPEGSNNRITDPGGANGQPIESAALRGLFQKESKRDIDGSSDPALSPYTGVEGLFHTGLIAGTSIHLINLVASINAFNQAAFQGALCAPSDPFCQDLQDLNQFIHEMDWGVGPLVGCASTVDAGNAERLSGPAPAGCSAACSDVAATISCMEEQALQANSGVAVQAWLDGRARGFWYDVTRGVYVEEPSSGLPVDRKTLIGLIRGDQDRLVFEATPLGSERRVAAPTGQSPVPEPGPAPERLRLLPMVSNSFYAGVPSLKGAWADLDNSGLQSLFIHTVRLFQWGLIQDAADANGFGLGQELRHDAPRRFQVSGADIRPGAWLHLAYHNDPDAGPVDPTRGLQQAQVSFLSFPIYATGTVDPFTGLPVYQTAVELEPLIYYALMLGGPRAPGVAAAYLDTGFTFPMEDPALDRSVPGEFQPLAWNFYYVFVSNADGSFGEGGWQRLTIQ